MDIPLGPGALTTPVEGSRTDPFTIWMPAFLAIRPAMDLGPRSHNWNPANPSLGNSGGPDYIGLPGVDISAGYHKYSAKVEPNKVTFYYDDVQKGNPVTPADNPGKNWSFGPSVPNGNWLILTLAIGGAGGKQKPAVQNAQMLVDRVEVRAN